MKNERKLKGKEAFDVVWTASLVAVERSCFSLNKEEFFRNFEFVIPFFVEPDELINEFIAQLNALLRETAATESSWYTKIHLFSERVDRIRDIYYIRAIERYCKES